MEFIIKKLFISLGFAVGLQGFTLQALHLDCYIV